MFGKLLSSTIKAVTLPIDAMNAAADIATGGDGSKRSRMNHIVDPLVDIELLRDQIAKTARNIDED